MIDFSNLFKCDDARKRAQKPIAKSETPIQSAALGLHRKPSDYGLKPYTTPAQPAQVAKASTTTDTPVKKVEQSDFSKKWDVDIEKMAANIAEIVVNGGKPSAKKAETTPPVTPRTPIIKQASAFNVRTGTGARLW